MPDRLHVTNGDAAADAITSAGVVSSVLPWVDVLHDGPVPDGLKLNELSRVRAEFIAANGWGNLEDIGNLFAVRDAAFGVAAEAGMLVLWFEADLYDQLQLIQLLSELRQCGSAAEDAELICIDDYFGQLDARAITTAYEQRKKVTQGQLALASAVWSAFREDTPVGLMRCSGVASDELPFLRAALIRFLEQYPGLGSGLSKTQLAALRAIAGGTVTPAAVFTSIAKLEDRIFLGDASFAKYLEAMSSVRSPLILFSNGAPVVGPRTGSDRKNFWHGSLALTAEGEAVFRGEADHITLNGIDHWLGGVHLTPDKLWRWDENAKVLVLAKP